MREREHIILYLTFWSFVCKAFPAILNIILMNLFLIEFFCGFDFEVLLCEDIS